MALLSAGISIAASDLQNNGGVKAIYIANKDDVDTNTAPTVSAHTVSAFALKSTKVWYQLVPEDFTIEVDYDRTAAGKMSSIKTKIKFMLPKYSATNLDFVNKLKEAAGIVVAIEFANASKVLFGWDSYLGVQAAMYIANGNGKGGSKPADKNEIEVNLEGEQIEEPYAYSFTPSLS